jgi:uncharacterized membrane protein
MIIEKNTEQLDLRLAWLLSYGTWLASILIGAGLALPALGIDPGFQNLHLITTGIAVIIGLPVLRVAFMCVSFIYEHDLGFAAASGVVLAIIAVAFVIGATAG